MTSPSASVRVGRSVLKAGAWLVPVTVQVKPSVSVSVPSLTVTSTVWLPALAKLRVPLMAPVAGSMLMPSGRPVAL